LEWPAP